jgi:hypothetical protein
MPTFDFDVITVGHGSGGLLTHNLLKSGVFNLLSNPWLDQQHDGAIFEINGKVAFSSGSDMGMMMSTECFVTTDWIDSIYPVVSAFGTMEK